jgi:hypothetical protein
MRRKFTILLLSALAALAIGAPQAGAVTRLDAAKAKAASVKIAVTRTAQYDGQYKRRFRPRRWGGRQGGFRRPFARGRMMSMREAVRLVRSRVPGRIANASLRGRFALFRVVSRGRVLTVVVNRVTRISCEFWL